MKKIKAVLVSVVLFAMLLCGCSVQKENENSSADVSSSKSTQSSTSDLSSSDANKKEDSSTNTSSVDSTLSNTSGSSDNDAVKPEISKLIDAHLYVMKNITGFAYLPIGDNPVEEHYYPVVSDQFKKVDDIKDYLATVYTETTVNQIMERMKNLYVDIDGKLCIDERHMGGKGYYVNWENYKLDINSVTGNNCAFTITASIEEPGENPVITPYVKELTAEKVNGNWRLTAFFE